MPSPLGAVSLTAGQPQNIYVGPNIGAVVIANESPYAVQASAGSGGIWIMAQTADRLNTDNMAFNGTLTLTASDYLNNTSDAPSTVVFLTAYASGETIPGTYPAPLVRMTTGVGGVASSIVNLANPAGTQVIQATPTGASAGVILTNDGNLTLNGTFSVKGTSSLDNGLITTDGTGNINAGQMFAGVFLGNAVSVTPTGNDDNLELHSATDQNATNIGVAHTGSAFGAGLYAYDTLNAGAIFQGGTKNSVTFTAQIIAGAPVKLRANFQETGTCGTGAQVTATGQFCMDGVNFKCVMTNTPSSITLTTIISNVLGSTAIANISTTGFRLQATSNAAGFLEFFGAYTTVGNCLLAVDTAAGTFDHHCDNCGTVARGVPIAAAQQTALSGGALALSYTCTNCGAQESFNCALTAADEQDTSPQGSGEYVTTRGQQATLIRQLMTALGLPVQP